MSELVFLLSADIDIQKAYEYYEAYQEGRGALFLNHLDAAFTCVRNFPEMAPVFQGRYRRLLVPLFPFAIFYTLEPDRIIVTAVMNLRQDPGDIRRRLQG
jgi:plasmid stabilization system protein ParE